MGRVEGSTVDEREAWGSLPGYARLDGNIPVVHPPALLKRASEVRDLLERGASALSGILAVEPPRLEALLVSDEDWEGVPRENEDPYPPGLPYYTRAASPPALVLPETLSPTFRPRTRLTGALVVWHELAHAFLLREPVPRSPAWLREFVPQALSAVVARRVSLPLDVNLREIGRHPGFAARSSLHEEPALSIRWPSRICCSRSARRPSKSSGRVS